MGLSPCSSPKKFSITALSRQVAVAVSLFGTESPAALATTVGVLTEVPVMLLVNIADRAKKYFKE